MTIPKNHLTEVLDFSGRASYSADHLATKPDARRVCRGRAAAARRHTEDRLGRRVEPPEDRRESAPLRKRVPEPQQGPFSFPAANLRFATEGEGFCSAERATAKPSRSYRCWRMVVLRGRSRLRRDRPPVRLPLTVVSGSPLRTHVRKGARRPLPLDRTTFARCRTSHCAVRLIWLTCEEVPRAARSVHAELRAAGHLPEVQAQYGEFIRTLRVARARRVDPR